MRRSILLLLLLLTAGCQKKALYVPGNSGTVTAINFCPGKIAGNPWLIYVANDVDGEVHINGHAKKPLFKVGDHITECYTESGEYFGMAKSDKPKRRNN